MENEIKQILQKLETGDNLKNDELNRINCLDYAVLGFTGEIGHLSKFGRNEMVKAYRTELIEAIKEYYE